MVDAKEGKIDAEYFKNIVQKKEVTDIKYGGSGLNEPEVQVDYLCQWSLNIFAYYNEKDSDGNIKAFTKDSLKV